MSDVIVISSERAAYRVGEGGFFGPDDTLYQEGAQIYFDGEPVEDFFPLNQLARDRLQALWDKLDEHAKLAAAKNGRTFTSRLRGDALLRQASADAHAAVNRVELTKGDGGIPLMGKASDLGSVSRVGAENTPETGGESSSGGKKAKVAPGAKLNIRAV